MQTFLPYSDYSQCAAILDNKRLNKQILECYQILNILSGQSKSNAWAHHPAVLMWAGAESHLYNYTMAMVKEANKRGIRTDKNVSNLQSLHNKCKKSWGYSTPTWYKPNHVRYVNTTHRTNLYRKDPIIYAEFSKYINSEYNKPCCDKCQYFWPTHEERNGR